MLNERDYMQPWRRTQPVSDVEAQALLTRALLERRQRAGAWPWMAAAKVGATMSNTPSTSNTPNGGDTARDDATLLSDIARTCGTDAAGAIAVMRRWREAGGYRKDIGTLGQRRLEFARWLHEHGKLSELSDE